jgi:hypothetical protein
MLKKEIPFHTWGAFVLAFCLGHLDGITNSRSVEQVK